MKEKFLYHTFLYVDYDAVNDYDIVLNQNDIILVKGIHHFQKCPHILFFVNDMNVLIQSLNLYPNTLIEFVPKAWVEPLVEAGFIVEAVFRDYWMKDLSRVKTDYNLASATIHDTTEITNLTQSRKGASRAFQGEEERFVNNWISNHIEEVDDTTVFIQKNENNIVGAIFVGLYNTPEKRTLWVRELVVDKSFEGKGIGKTLLQTGLSYGYLKGAVRAFLIADDLNNNALHLYQKIGFEPDLSSEQINMMTKKA